MEDGRISLNKLTGNTAGQIIQPKWKKVGVLKKLTGTTASLV